MYLNPTNPSNADVTIHDLRKQLKRSSAENVAHMFAEQFNQFWRAHWRKVVMLYVALAALIITSNRPEASGVMVSFDQSDLDGFFSWFNMMFDAILPIALVGAGLMAGTSFAFLVAYMLRQAFRSLTGSRMS